MTRAGRRAPAGGYTFGNKREYRRRVWAAFARACAGHASAAQVLLMPSSEGEEIVVALRAGFREQNLHICDRNPAIVAHLKRRYPLAQTYGVSVERACERIGRAGLSLAAANLDLTGCVCEAYYDLVARCAATGVLDRSVVAVTFQRGRERGWPRAVSQAGDALVSLVDRVAANPGSSVAILLRQLARLHCGRRDRGHQLTADFARAQAVGLALATGLEQHVLWQNPDASPVYRRRAEVLRFEAYHSGKLTMGWVMAVVRPTTDEDPYLWRRAQAVLPRWVLEELRAEGLLTPRP